MVFQGQQRTVVCMNFKRREKVEVEFHFLALRVRERRKWLHNYWIKIGPIKKWDHVRGILKDEQGFFFLDNAYGVPWCRPLVAGTYWLLPSGWTWLATWWLLMRPWLALTWNLTRTRPMRQLPTCTMAHRSWASNNWTLVWTKGPLLSNCIHLKKSSMGGEG